MITTPQAQQQGGSPLGSLSCSPLPDDRKDALTKRFCRKQADYLWGQKRFVTPVLLPKQWGDGLQLIALRPIILRMAWYVIAIDSSMDIGSGWRDLLDEEIYEELEDHFGRVTPEDQKEEGFDCHAAWPAVNHDCGHEWWQISSENARFTNKVVMLGCATGSRTAQYAGLKNAATKVPGVTLVGYSDLVFSYGKNRYGASLGESTRPSSAGTYRGGFPVLPNQGSQWSITAYPLR